VLGSDGVPGEGLGRAASVPHPALHADSGSLLAFAAHRVPVIAGQLRAAGASPGLSYQLAPPGVLAPFPVMRTQLFTSVPTWLAQMKTPIGFATGGFLVAYYARDEIYRSYRDANSVTMAIRVTEDLMMACNRWY